MSDDSNEYWSGRDAWRRMQFEEAQDAAEFDKMKADLFAFVLRVRPYLLVTALFAWAWLCAISDLTKMQLVAAIVVDVAVGVEGLIAIHARRNR